MLTTLRHAVVAALLFAAAAPVARAATEERVEIPGADDFTLIGTLYAPAGPTSTAGAPAVILLPMLGKDRASFARLAREIADEDGILALTVDLRGHGESVLQGEEKRTHKYFVPDDWAGIPRDAVLAIRWLAARPGVDPKRIGVVGASIGANAGLVAAGEEPGVRAAVLISPGLDYRGIKILPALKAYEPRPVLVVTGKKEDAYAAETLAAMRAAGRPNIQSTVEWTGHGTEILESVAAARKTIRTFLKTYLLGAEGVKK